MNIGEVARRAGIRSSAVRYYEAAGLLPRAARSGGQRRYGPDVLDRLALIAFAKTAGFRLAEIRGLASGPKATWPALVARRRSEIAALEIQLRLAKRALRRVERCACDTAVECGRRIAESERGQLL